MKDFFRPSTIYAWMGKTDVNDRLLDQWHAVTRPRLIGVKEKWAQLDVDAAADEHLLSHSRDELRRRPLLVQ